MNYRGADVYLNNDNWEVEISEIDYNPDSADNIIQPDDYIVLNEEYPKTILINVSDANHSAERNIVLSVSFFTPIVKRKELALSGTLFSVHPYRDDFILYCEMNIIRMNQNLDVIWDYMARDIFVRYKGEEPAFEMRKDRIRLYDFSDSFYEIDYNGKVIID